VLPCRIRSVDRWQRDRGAAAVEFALIVPLLCLFLLGIIDFGRLWYTQINLTEAAREGARLESLGSSQVYSQTVAGATGFTGLTIYINGTKYTSDPGMPIPCPVGTNANVRVVSTGFTFTLAALTGIGPITLAGTAVIPCGG